LTSPHVPNSSGDTVLVTINVKTRPVPMEIIPPAKEIKPE